MHELYIARLELRPSDETGTVGLELCTCTTGSDIMLSTLGRRGRKEKLKIQLSDPKGTSMWRRNILWRPLE